MYSLDVLSPVAQNQSDAETFAAAPRPATLDGLVVGLVWNKKRGGLEALDRVGQLIRSRYRGVEIRTYEGSQPCRPEVLQQALRECDVFVGSTGD